MPLNRILLSFLMIITLVAGLTVHAEETPPDQDYSKTQITEFSEVVEEPIAVERNLDVEIQLKKTSYLIPFPSHDVMERFSQLDADTQQRFLEKRVMYHIILTKTLNALKYGIGAGSLLKDKLTFRKKKNDESVTEQEKQEIEKLTFKLRSHNGVLNILKSFDKFMWSKPDFVAKSNELGATFSANLVAFADYKKAKGGGAFGIGISIGVNIERKAVVIQVYRNIEKYRSTILKAAGMIGVVFKGGGYFVGDNEKLYRSEGYSFYPPVAPGFFSETPTKYIAGGTLGLTLPPSPIGDILTYTMDFDDKTLFKMEFSAVSKYFVQVHSANPSEMFKLSAYPVNQVLMSLRYRSVMSCGRLFN